VPFSESIFNLNNKTVRSELICLLQNVSIYTFQKEVGFAESALAGATDDSTKLMQ